MALAYVSSGEGDSGASGGTTIATEVAQATVTGNFMVVGVRFTGTTQTITGVADTAGNTYTVIATVQYSGDTKAMYYAKNITSNASNIVTATLDLNAAYKTIVASEFSGGHATALLDTSATGTGTASPITSGTFTTAEADEVLVAVAEIANLGTTWTQGSGYTIAVQSDDTISALQYQIVSSIQTGVTSEMSNSDGASPKVIIVATFKSDGGGGGSIVPVLMHHYRQRRN